MGNLNVVWLPECQRFAFDHALPLPFVTQMKEANGSGTLLLDFDPRS